MLQIEFDTTAPTLRAFLESDASVQFVMGPLGSGKTNAFVFKVFCLICQQPPQRDGVRRSRWIITRNTYADLENTTIRDWRAIVGSECGQFINGHPPEHRLRFTLDDGTRVESDVVFIALDRVEHVKKLRGFQATAAWMNEAKEQPKGVLDMLTLRVGRYPAVIDGGCAFAGVLGDYNAPDDDHWLFDLHQRWMRGELPDYGFFIQPGAVQKVGDAWRVNPDAENLANLPPGYYEKGMQGKSEDWIKVNLANEYGFVQDGKPVYPEYVDSLHFRPVLPHRALELHIGLDFGLTPAAAFVQRTAFGSWRAVDELVTQDMGVKRFGELLAQRIREKYEGFVIGSITGDPAGDTRLPDDEERTVFNVLAVAGIVAKPARTNDFTVRRQAVATLLSTIVDGQPALVVGPQAPTLRKALAGRYRYKRLQIAGEERYRDVPDKTHHSHIAEACQYALVGAGEDRAVVTAKPRRTGSIRVVSDYDYFS